MQWFWGPPRGDGPPFEDISFRGLVGFVLCTVSAPLPSLPLGKQSQNTNSCLTSPTNACYSQWCQAEAGKVVNAIQMKGGCWICMAVRQCTSVLACQPAFLISTDWNRSASSAQCIVSLSLSNSKTLSILIEPFCSLNFQLLTVLRSKIPHWNFSSPVRNFVQKWTVSPVFPTLKQRQRKLCSQGWCGRKCGELLVILCQQFLL